MNIKASDIIFVAGVQFDNLKIVNTNGELLCSVGDTT
jgi:hypothetical protein